jgi:hypothetical protein
MKRNHSPRIRTTHRRARTAIAITVLAATALGLAGCFNPFFPLISSSRGVSEPPPLPISPVSTLRLFGWCWENRAIEEYRELFTDDYQFVFSQLDSAGNAFRDVPWTREDEMISATNLFVGGGAEPPADRITLDFTNTLREFSSRIDGHDPKWHRQIDAEVNLRVQRGDNTLEVRGFGTFFFVRGDSAALPEELVQRGFQPDSNRWYIERWEDNTVQTGAFAARTPVSVATAASYQIVAQGPLPPSLNTWGAIKAYFLIRDF